MIVTLSDQTTADLFAGKRVRRCVNIEALSSIATLASLRAPLGMSAHTLAQALKVPASRINDIVLERWGVTVDTALRLVRCFGGDVPTWMNLQTAFAVKVAEKDLAPRMRKNVLPLSA